MATYNTAFGTLPGYNEMLGKTNTTAGGLDGGQLPQQTGAYQGARRQTRYQQQGQVGTFADLQKQGRARPAPQEFQSPEPVQQAPSGMIQQLRQQLGGGAPAGEQQATGKWFEQNRVAPSVAAPAQAAPSIAAPAPVAMPAVESPMLNAIKQQLGAVAKSAEGAPETGGADTWSVSGLGLPSGPAPETAGTTPPVSTGTTWAGIAFAPNDPNGPWVTDGDNWTTVDGQPYPIGPAAQSWEFVNGKWQHKGQNVPGSNVPVYPGGGGPISTPTGEPLPPVTIGKPTAPPAAPPASPTPTAPPFSIGDLYVKPNMPTAPTPFSISQGTLDVQKQLRDMLTKLQNAPSPYEQEAYRQALASGTANLQAKYGAEKSALEEELARRGLSASTFGAGRYGDLAGQQARALATMQSDLLQKAADQEAARQQVVMQGLGSLGQQMSSQDIAQYNANLEAYKTSGQFEMDAAKLQQDAKVQGITLTLQQARDVVDANYKTQTLQNQLAEIAARKEIAQQQSSANLLGQLMGQLDLSQLSQDQINALLAPYGITMPKTAVSGPQAGTPTSKNPTTTPTSNQDPSVDYSHEGDFDGPEGWTAPDTPTPKPRSWNGKVYVWDITRQKWMER